jgi:hypothetical protein
VVGNAAVNSANCPDASWKVQSAHGMNLRFDESKDSGFSSYSPLIVLW